LLININATIILIELAVKTYQITYVGLFYDDKVTQGWHCRWRVLSEVFWTIVASRCAPTRSHHNVTYSLYVMV